MLDGTSVTERPPTATPTTEFEPCLAEIRRLHAANRELRNDLTHLRTALATANARSAAVGEERKRQLAGAGVASVAAAFAKLAALEQLVREALSAFLDPETAIDLRDWTRTARAHLARPEGVPCPKS